MTSRVRPVIKHLDGTTEAGPWHERGSQEASDALRELIRAQTREGWTVSWEEETQADAAAE
ncbi:MAG TPA: hypothetical protein VGV35_21960 [Bryobacteraceae bacterium]|nr:hypothetical protein [Bryobacteraceae bacterium]